MITIYTDGGSRGNPGPAAAAYIILDKEGKEIDKKGFYLGIQTNNFAEYKALEKALEKVIEINPNDDVQIIMDSELVVKQMRGEYKIKNENILPLANKCKLLIKSFVKTVSFSHTLRSGNQQTDLLVNKVLDEN